MQVGDKAKFYWCAGAGLMGVIVTILFIPEISELDLREGDKRWELLKAGEPCTTRNPGSAAPLPFTFNQNLSLLKMFMGMPCI